MSAPWRTVPLSEVVLLQRGHDLPTPDRSAGDVPIIGSFGVTGTHDTALYEGPGVAIGRSGAAIGTATFVNSAYWPLNTCLFVRDFKGNDPRWIYYLLDSIDFTAFNSGSAQPSLNRNFLRDFPVALPPLAEQQAIAEVMGTLDDKMAANERRAALTADLADSLFVAARQQACRSLGLADLVDTQYGVTTSATHGTGPRLLRVTDINKKPWIEWNTAPSCQLGEPELTRYRLRGGDILVARMADPGKAAMIDDDDPDAVFASYLVRLRAHSSEHAAYIYYFLRSAEYQQYAHGSSSGSVQRNMNAKVIVGTSISLPSDYRLSEFNTRIFAHRRSLSAILRESNVLMRTRDELLPLVMSGKVRVREAEEVV